MQSGSRARTLQPVPWLSEEFHPNSLIPDRARAEDEDDEDDDEDDEDDDEDDEDDDIGRNGGTLLYRDM